MLASLMNNLRGIANEIATMNSTLFHRLASALSRAAFFFLLCLMLAGQSASAATNDLSALLQKGLFEEEANHNLEAAEQAYRSVATEFDKDRKLAATAIFRLGEVYRKQGRASEAKAQYERILREFSDQKILADLSRSHVRGAVPSPASIPDPSMAPKTSSSVMDGVVVVDNSLAEFHGIWTTSQTAPDKYDRDYRFSSTVVGTNNESTVTFRPKVTKAGKYHVETWFPAGANRAPNATWKIRSANDKSVITIQVNQRTGGKWLRLASDMQFEPGSASITLSSVTGQSGAVVVADAVRLVPVELADVSRPSTSSEAVTTTSEEAEEIRRIQVLIKNSPDLINALRTTIYDGDESKGSPLHRAAANGHIEVAKFLIDHGADIELKSTQGSTPLYLAVVGAHKAMLELLLDRGANIHGQSSSGTTPLHLASERGYRAIVETLLVRGADPNRLNREQLAPLHLAAKAGQDMIVKLLLENKADVNLSSPMTPLWKAVEYERERVVELLIRNGANANLKQGEHTSEKSLLHVAAALENSRILESLLKAGVDPNTVAGPYHPTALFTAVERKLLPNVKALIAGKANVNYPNETGHVPLHFAASHAVPDIVNELVVGGADVNALDGSGRTVLWHAVAQGRLSVMEILLKNGANPNLAGANSQTPLNLAKSKIFTLPTPQIPGQGPVDWNKVVELLKKHGANDLSARVRRIAVTRPAWKEEKPMFYKDSDELMQVSLLELFVQMYRDGIYDSAFAFPDLAKLTIRRLMPDGQEKQIKVDFEKIFAAGDCSKDIGLEWGDVIEIPELDHRVKDSWDGWTKEKVQPVAQCLDRTVSVSIKGETKEVPFRVQPSSAGVSWKFSTFDPYLYTAIVASGLLRASSDLSQVKLTRVNVNTKEPKEYTFNLAGDKKPGFWLRNGDKIEVPERNIPSPVSDGGLRTPPTRTLRLPPGYPEPVITNPSTP